MPKRKLHKKELSFLIRVQDLNNDFTLRKGRWYHIVRQTPTGHKIAACTMGQKALDVGEGYYTVPYMVFLYDCLFPYICTECEDAAVREITPASNTGVNFSYGGSE